VRVLEELREGLVALGRDDIAFNAILDKGSENDLWTITSICDYPIFVSTDTLDGWAAQGGERSVVWVYNTDGTLADSVGNPWLKGVGVPINMTVFKADINKVIQKSLEAEAAFQAQ
jgi:hypothetical protein